MRVLRGVLLALLVSAAVGFAIGTVIRLRLERPSRYIGYDNGSCPGSAVPTDPLDIGKLRPRVFHPRHHEEQVG